MSLWNRLRTIAVILITSVLLQAQQSEKANNAPQSSPATELSATTLEGNWSVTPLVMKGAVAPGGTGQLLEFGEAYRTETFLAFWARTGPNLEKDWALFSLKDGQLTRVLQRDVKFVAPDSRKITFSEGMTIHVGKLLLYFFTEFPHHIYAWDGEKLVKVLAAGDELQSGNERFTIRRARVLDTSPDGRALIEVERTFGLAVHDGSSFTHVLKMGGDLPGMPGMRMDSRCASLYRSRCEYAKPRLLEDDSMLVSLWVSEGGRKRFALFRIFPKRTDVIVEQDSAFIGCNAQRLILPNEVPVRVTTQCDGYTFTFTRGEAGKPLEMEIAEVVSAKQTLSGQKKSLGVLSANGNYLVPDWIAPSNWKRRLDNVSQIRLGESNNSVLVFARITPGSVLAATPRDFAIADYHINQILVSYAGTLRMAEYDTVGDRMDIVYNWVPLVPNSPNSMVEVVDLERKSWALKPRFRSRPKLYFWNGEKLSAVAWEESVGISNAKVAELLQTSAPSDMVENMTDDEADAAGKVVHIKIRAIPGPTGGVSVRLPDLGVKPRTWYVPANSTDGKLQQAPRFPVAEHAITVADVISWKENEILALTDEGLFRLRRTEQ